MLTKLDPLLPATKCPFVTFSLHLEQKCSQKWLIESAEQRLSQTVRLCLWGFVARYHEIWVCVERFH